VYFQQNFEYLEQIKTPPHLRIQTRKLAVLRYFIPTAGCFQKNRECQNLETYAQNNEMNNAVTVVIIAYFSWTCKYFLSVFVWMILCEYKTWCLVRNTFSPCRNQSKMSFFHIFVKYSNFPQTFKDYYSFCMFWRICKKKTTTERSFVIITFCDRFCFSAYKT